VVLLRGDDHHSPQCHGLHREQILPLWHVDAQSEA
jgi:hypothetical protein